METYRGADLDFRLSPRQRSFIPRLGAARLIDYIFHPVIVPYTEAFQAIRKVGLKQLRRFPAELVTELARIILFDHGLRLLSYELVFYQREALPGEGSPGPVFGRRI